MKTPSWIGLMALILAPTAQAADTLTPAPKRPPAPDFTLKDVNGKLHSLSDQKGKVVLVNFWATWCPPCRKEMPSMQRAWDKLKKENFTNLYRRCQRTHRVQRRRRARMGRARALATNPRLDP